ncbi:MAG: hypothetical protein JXB36_19180, partial [Gammaproteobacteria bacterium]|nr:hypothetical protein [Gammaproteobacteria bacterium]
AFDGYVEQDGRGMHRPVRLPAIDDPMFRYVKNVRQREQVFLQTLDLHYESFASRAAASYGSWREAAREESMTMRELKRSVRWRRALGIAAVVASIASSMNGGIGDGPTGRLIQDSLMMMGAGVLDMGNLRQEEIRLHADILEEVSQSFDDEVKPLVVDIAGTQHRLTGTAQMQYAEWRELLQRVFAEQAGIVRPENVERHEICFESEPKDQTATAGC